MCDGDNRSRRMRTSTAMHIRMLERNCAGCLGTVILNTREELEDGWMAAGWWEVSGLCSGEQKGIRGFLYLFMLRTECRFGIHGDGLGLGHHD